MDWIVGVDGGGSKTAIVAKALGGAEERTCRVASICPHDHGIEGFSRVLVEAFRIMGVPLSGIAAICLGIPCFGEYPALDEAVTARTRQLFPNAKIRCENDCFVGFAGAFGLKSGINVVAGTGAIAFGMDEKGSCARSNGWHSGFSDEGSGAWLGRQAFSLYCKQLDGRAERSVFSDIFREALGLVTDTDVIAYYNAHCENDRTGLAKAQELLLKAARLGDAQAIDLYNAAARELSHSVLAVYRALDLASPVRISYSGGVFRADNFLLVPFTRMVQEAIPNSLICPPLYSAEYGALLAAERLLASETM